MAIAGAILGAQYNALQQFRLPSISLNVGEASKSGMAALIISLVVTLLAAISGGNIGERCHHKADESAIDDTSE